MYKRRPMRYISILLILSATSSCHHASISEAEEPHKDTVIIIDYIRGTDTIIIDTTAKPQKKCQKSLDSQIQSLKKMEKKLDRLKRKMQQRNKKRNKRKGNAYI